MKLQLGQALSPSSMTWVLEQGTQFWADGFFVNLSNRLKIITGEHFKDIKASSSYPKSLCNLYSANSAQNRFLCLINFYWNKIHAESFLLTIAVISLSPSTYSLVNITFLSLRLNFLPVLLSTPFITSSGNVLHQLHILFPRLFNHAAFIWLLLFCFQNVFPPKFKTFITSQPNSN